MRCIPPRARSGVLSSARPWVAASLVCTGLGALCCGAAGWLLSDTEQAVQREAPLRVALVDVSDSVTRVRRSWASWVREALESEARAAAEAGEPFAVVAFAEEVVRWHGPDQPEAFAFDPQWLAGAPARRAGSDVAAALLAAERLAEGAGRGALVRILGDGSFTGLEPLAQLARVQAELVSLPEAELADPWLRSVEAAPELEPGAPLALRVEWEREGLDTGRGLALRVRGLPAGERRFELAAGGARVERLELGPMGSRDLELAVTLECEGDPIPENNVASVRVRARGALQVELVCTPAQAGPASALAAAWGGADGVGVHVSSASRVQAIDADTDLLVTLDLDPRAVEVAAIGPFLARGGGWLAAGGGALLAGLDARDERSAARYLPCEPDEDDDARDVLLVVDVSGSMDDSSFDGVRNAAVALVERLRARDEVFLHFFTDRLGEAVRLGAGAAEPGSEGERARLLLAARRPSGPTDLPSVFEQLVEAREARRTRACILVLTDGRDQRALPSARGRLAVALERLSEAGAEVRVLASGPQPDLEFLACFDRAELRASVALLGPELGEALERAANDGRWVERPRTPRVSSGAASDAVRELRSTLVDAPVFLRTVALRSRSGDGALLEDDEGHVLAAARAEGAGACAVLATLPGPEGSPQWRAQALDWLPWVRALARGRAAAQAAPAARWIAGRLELGPFEPEVGRNLRVFRGGPAGGEEELQLALARQAAFPVGTYVECVAPEGLPRGSHLRLEAAGLPQGVLSVPERCAEEYLRPARTFEASPVSGARGAGVRHPNWGWGALGLGIALISAGSLFGSRAGRVHGP